MHINYTSPKTILLSDLLISFFECWFNSSFILNIRVIWNFHCKKNQNLKNSSLLWLHWVLYGSYVFAFSSCARHLNFTSLKIFSYNIQLWQHWNSSWLTACSAQLAISNSWQMRYECETVFLKIILSYSFISTGFK